MNVILKIVPSLYVNFDNFSERKIIIELKTPPAGGLGMTYKTKGIILRTIKYGETSLVATVFTELFGVQTYMVNGVRVSGKTSSKGNAFQPGAVLEMVVYHHEQKNMQRIKEFKWAFLYEHVLSDVIKNNIALYMVELLYKCLKQPEKNEALFYFCEDALLQLDKANKIITANFALYFSLHLSHFFGFKPLQTSPDGEAYKDSENLYFDFLNGEFTLLQPDHNHYIDKEYAQLTLDLLKVMQPHELEYFNLNQIIRRKLLLNYQDYYALHIQDFGQLKTLVVLHEVL